MEEITIYEKPTCSKCRAALQMLDANSVLYRAVRYHDTPLSFEKLSELVRKLGISPKELVRKEGPQFRALKPDLKKLTDAEVVQLMLDYPDLMQRPILERGDHAIVGRPSERILEWL